MVNLQNVSGIITLWYRMKNTKISPLFLKYTKQIRFSKIILSYNNRFDIIYCRIPNTFLIEYLNWIYRLYPSQIKVHLTCTLHIHWYASLIYYSTNCQRLYYFLSLWCSLAGLSVIMIEILSCWNPFLLFWLSLYRKNVCYVQFTIDDTNCFV